MSALEKERKMSNEESEKIKGAVKRYCVSVFGLPAENIEISDTILKKKEYLVSTKIKYPNGRFYIIQCRVDKNTLRVQVKK